MVVGRDMRPDGAELSGAFCEGVVAAGVDVVVGLCATEMVASGMLDAPGAMFTASHNPVGYNASSLRAGRVADRDRHRARGGQGPGCRGLSQAVAPGNAARRDLLDAYVEHVCRS